VTNAVDPVWRNVKQEAADELVDGKIHDLLAIRAIAAIILVAQGNTGLVEGKQPPVRDGDAVRIPREIGENGFGTGEGRLGVDRPSFTANWREVAPEGLPVSKWCKVAEEDPSGGVVECNQPGEEQAAEQLAQHAHYGS
jgi:hypothetical protein